MRALAKAFVDIFQNFGRPRLEDKPLAQPEPAYGKSAPMTGLWDTMTDEQKNIVLSQKRADAVRTYLTTHGIPEDRVTAEGVGEAQPIADNKTAEGRANNRRVEIILNGSANTEGTPMPGNDQSKGKNQGNQGNPYNQGNQGGGSTP